MPQGRTRSFRLVPPLSEHPLAAATRLTLTVGFGPTRSRLLPRALDHARAGGAALTELSPGRFRATFHLERDRAAFAHAAALCALVRRWRASDFFVQERRVVSTLVWEMGVCAAEQLTEHGGCQFGFEDGIVPDRCDLCPLFDPNRALAHVAAPRPRRVGAASADIGQRPSRSSLRVVREDERGIRPITFVLVFGPSRSSDFERALRKARVAATKLDHREDGSYRAEFVLAEDPEPYLALEAICRLLVLVRGTELSKGGLPVPLAAVYRARQQLRQIYAVPPPRDLIGLVLDDLTDTTLDPGLLPP